MTTPAEKKGLVLYVAVAKKRLVIPIQDPAQRVFELGALIASRFRVDRVAELRTGDGFLLDANDVVGEVLRDQQVISCLDYTGWVDENHQIINQNRNAFWAELEQPDFIDEKVKWVRCGFAQNMGKFYVRMGGERGLYAPMQLDLFEAADLMSIAKKGKHVIAQIGDEKTGWFASAEFTAGENGVVDTIVLRCKSKSDAREAIKSIKMKVTPGADIPITVGDIKLEQTSELPEEPYNYSEPAAEIKGPSFPVVEEKKVDPKAPKPEAPEIKGEGSLPLLITLKMFPEIDRGYQRNVGTSWDNTISMEFEFLNRGESSLILTKWTAEYKDKEGKWQNTKLLRGSRRGFWNYSWDSQNKDSIPIYGKVPQKFALGVALPIDAPQLNRARALHSSLPNPLELKFTVADINGGSVSIVVPVKSTFEDLDLISKTKEVNNNGNNDKPCIGYVQCDDTANEGRIMAALYKKSKTDVDEFELRQNMTSSYHTYNTTFLKKIAFQNAAKGIAEFKLTDSCHKDDKPGCTMESYALIDIPRKRVWAIKVALSTSTSSATSTFLLNPPVAAATPVVA